MALSPMMRQYMDVKKQHPDCIVMFRLGDFYEMFFDDAKEISKALGLTLTGRDCGLEERAPMCGVPYHAVDGYVAQMVKKGYKVAICEQLTDPAESRGLVERGLTRIVTAGTATGESMLQSNANNYLLAVFGQGDGAGLCYADVSTGELTCMEAETRSELAEAVFRISPAELLANEASLFVLSSLSGAPKPHRADPPGDDGECMALVRRHTGHDAERIADSPRSVRAAATLLSYLEDTQMNALGQITSLAVFRASRHMVLDPVARRNLELTRTIAGQSGRGTLLHLLDRTACSMGARTLRSFIENPLCDLAAISRRQQAVAELAGDFVRASRLREVMGGVYDIERLVTKLAYGSINGRDMNALKTSLEAVPLIRSLLAEARCDMLRELLCALDPLTDMAESIAAAICDEPPVTVREGKLIRSGFDPEIDRLRDISANAQRYIAEMESAEREKTGIKGLKIGFNRVFGYYIEISRAQAAQVPYTYTRRQTLSSSERYINAELKKLEDDVLGSEDKLTRLEYTAFCQLRDKLASAISRFKSTAGALKVLDALNSLALAATEYGYTRPEMTDGFDMEIVGGRHPVVEQTGEEQFVPNDTCFTSDERLVVITGPNMAGKSTYLRQVALITLMAHIGSFVPAQKAVIPLTDRIFTRIGAQDNLAAGQSTFMVEMNELSSILAAATSRSLLILDEIGRGTSTFDGLAIAWATVEHIADTKRLGAKTLFATHYHELSELEGRLPGIVNCRIAVKEHGEQIIFLRKIMRGGSDRSFGVQVAALAGLPRTVVGRAHEIMARLEASDVTHSGIGSTLLDEPKGGTGQVDMTSLPYLELAREIASIDVNSMTPMEALNKLYILREKAKQI